MRETLVVINDAGKENPYPATKPVFTSSLLERERYYDLAG
jgi:hypothetical protein